MYFQFQKYTQKAKQLKAENEENTVLESTENKKRKRDEDDLELKESKDISNKKLKDNSSVDKKKPLAQSTNSKLAGFSFNKDST